MKKRNPKPILILAVLLFAGYIGFGFSSSSKSEAPVSQDYIDVANYGDVFIAITNHGRIDQISENGDIIQSQKLEGESLENIDINGHQIIISGTGGSIYFKDDDNEFRLLNTGSTNAVNCLTSFKNKIIAGYDRGELRIGNPEEPFKPIKLNLKGNIVSLSSGNSVCYGVTDQGEIIHSVDGENWDIFDFNKTYNGYYKSCAFLNVLVTPKQIAVVGKSGDGSPVLYFSSKGNVWTQRPLIFDDEKGNSSIMEDIPTGIYYDSWSDQYLLLCLNGKLMTIPSCSHCHKLYNFPENKFRGISGNERTVIIVGDNNYINTINPEFL